MKYIFSLLVVGVLLTSCAMNEGPSDVTVSIPYLKDTLSLDNGAYCLVETPLIWEDKVMYLITNFDTKEGWIICYDKHSMELIWRWQEAMDEFGIPARGFGFVSHVYQGILAIAHSNLSYGIDINTGETLWKNRSVESGASIIFGHEKNISTIRTQEWQVHKSIVATVISEGNWNSIYDIVKDDSLYVSLGAPLPFYWDGKDYITFLSGKWGTSPHIEINWLNLYNLTDDRLEWTSDTIPIKFPLSGIPGAQPSFEDGQILLGNDAIYSYNVEDGSLEWWKWYGNSFVINNKLTAAEGIVYGNNASQFFVGLDVHTGEEIVHTTTGGSPSKIAYHDGKCYLSSVTVGATNRIMVIDALTGEILRNELAPFRDEDKEWTFDRAVAVDAETGLVYTADHRSLLVYDFEL